MITLILSSDYLINSRWNGHNEEHGIRVHDGLGLSSIHLDVGGVSPIELLIAPDVVVAIVILVGVGLPVRDFSESAVDVIGLSIELHVGLSSSTQSDHGVHEQQDLDAHHELITADLELVPDAVLQVFLVAGVDLVQALSDEETDIPLQVATALDDLGHYSRGVIEDWVFVLGQVEHHIPDLFH